MKRYFSTALAFLCVSAIVFGVVFLLRFLTGVHAATGWRYYLIVGLAGGLGGLFGPMISERIIHKFKKS